RVYLRLTSNIHTGGDALDATDELAPEEREMIERAARSIPGLRIAGFDVLLPREDQEEDTSASILEINANRLFTVERGALVGGGSCGVGVSAGRWCLGYVIGSSFGCGTRG